MSTLGNGFKMPNEFSAELSSAFQQESTPALVSSPKGRKRKLRVGNVFFAPYMNGAPDVLIPPEKLDVGQIPSYNHRLMRSILSLKGLIIGGADEHMARTTSGKPLDKGWISQYVHPDVGFDRYTDLECAIKTVLGGQKNLSPHDNWELVRDQILDRDAIFAAVDTVLMSEGFEDVASVADAHWQRISSRSHPPEA